MPVLPALLVSAALSAAAPQEAPAIRIVPEPAHLEAPGGTFRIDADTRISLLDPADAEARRLAEFFAVPLRAASGFALPVTRGGSGEIVLGLDPGAFGEAGPLESTGLDTRAERYRLEVGPDGIRLTAPAWAGLFRGIETLRQLLPATYEDGYRATHGRAWLEPGATPAALDVRPLDWLVPAVRIEDEPRFRYRGLHLDVGRHFFPVSFIREYIDLIAQYRLNVFHWHLTEDQGWRLEIRQYPRLTQVGAFRRETILRKNFDPYVGDGVPHGGYYTQDEVREIVAYAAERYVTIVPEIEMPGHSVAALAAYPELACTPGPFEVSTVWGVSDDILCPSEATFTFLENVLSEVVGLFPGPYVHIGGDEAPKKRWKESEVAQEIIRREGLADENALQSWFTQRIENWLADHGRRLIGWDEILEGGIPPRATVMSWRGVEGGIEAARAGHDVIMTPTSHLYLDYYQGDPTTEPLAIGGFLPLEKVYGFEPVPSELGPDEAAHVIGAQGNVWTEYMASRSHVEYMAFPRALALAELAWSPAASRDFDTFTARLPAALARLGRLGVNYRPLRSETGSREP
ncbi:MAG: beta-N-acetylhexosaminidase [Gemmatimonadota bacterium]|jgi:hexosaminidase